jgi:UDP-2,4-diacetamido-2,4,6-trideoxy-beta-L-altropyranose hydrolase
VIEHVKVSKIALVTEGGPQIGMGHVYRSTTIAEELRGDALLLFLTKSDDAIARIRRSGFNATLCKTDEEILGRLSQIGPTMIILDAPQLSARFIENIRATLDVETRIVVFDAHFAPEINRQIDVIVNAILRGDFANEFIYDQDVNTQYYFGPRYLVLRPEFFNSVKQRPRLNHPHEKKLLLLFGGGDYANLTTRTLDRILRFDKERCIHIIVGPAFGHLEELNAVIQAHTSDSSRIKVDKDATNVGELMNNADVVITSPGLSMFEALRLRKTVIAIYQNEFQKVVYKNFPLKCIVEQSDISHIDALLEDFEHFDQDGVDKLQIGEGKTALLQAIRNFLSPYEIIDLKSGKVDRQTIIQYVRMRNLYADLLNTEHTDVERSLNWLRSSNVLAMGIVRGGDLLGVFIIYLDKKNEVAIFSNPRDIGTGRALLAILDHIASINCIKSVWAWVRSTNLQALAFFTKAGWKKQFEDDATRQTYFRKQFGETPTD